MFYWVHDFKERAIQTQLTRTHTIWSTFNFILNKESEDVESKGLIQPKLTLLHSSLNQNF